MKMYMQNVKSSPVSPSGSRFGSPPIGRLDPQGPAEAVGSPVEKPEPEPPAAPIKEVPTVDARVRTFIYEKREQWNRAIDFLLACIGFSVGLGNVWRFPYLCYKNGGGAFLIPYFLSVLFGGIPLFYLEIAIGQFMSKGGLQAWNLVPMFQGIGLASCIIVFLLDCYYNIILTWAFYYFFSSFTSELPWQRCGHAWNTPNCTDPVTEFWENKVLGLTDGLHNLGRLKPDLALCLVFTWFVVYLCICKGIKTSGKVMYVTATSPYIFMIILLVRNSQLDGAMDGIGYYLTPNITKLGEASVWVDAGTQILFSSSIALGTLTALGSYNTFKHNSYRDSLIFACVNSGTSLLAGFIVFTILGFMAKQQGKSIHEVAESGPGLAFIVYPNAVAQLPLAPLWSVCFFLMLILLGLDSQFVGVEGVITTVVDQYPRLLRRGYRKEAFVACVCVLMCAVGMFMVCEGGMYVFQLFDYYSGSRIIALVAFLECFAVSYVYGKLFNGVFVSVYVFYGIRRFYDNVLMMVGHTALKRTLPYMLFCWTVMTPLFSMTVFCLSLLHYSELTYTRSNSRVYVYPLWGVTIGWIMGLSSVVWIPIVGIYKFFKFGGNMTVFKLMMVPHKLHKHQMRPQDHDEMNLRRYDAERRGIPIDDASTCSNSSSGVGEPPLPCAKTASWTIGYTS